MNRTTAIMTLSAVMLATAAGLLLAGPLSPPGGPPAPTYKTLTEVEPRIIINAANTPGDSDSVFRITQPGSYYLTTSIQAPVGKRAIEIACSDVTIDLMGFALDGEVGSGFVLSLEGVRVSAQNVRNIRIRNGMVRDFGETGIMLFGDGVEVSEIIVSGCGGDGIYASSQSALVRNCQAIANGSSGIKLAVGGSILGCSVSGNGQNGITCGQGCVVEACSARSNTGNGIDAGGAATVTGNTCCLNTGDGIAAFVWCLVSGNTCQGNGFNGTAAGIRTSGSNNRIERNHISTSDSGIVVSGEDNFVASNTVVGCGTNYSIAAGNTFGPITTMSGVIATNNPWANFQD